MASTSWKWVVAAVVCAAVLGAGGGYAFGPGTKHIPQPSVALAPVPVAADNNPAGGKPIEEVWIIEPDPYRRLKGSPTVPSSVFPELTIPEPDPGDPDWAKHRRELFTKVCPRLAGERKITIDPTDGTLRKLLKARLNHGVIEMIRFREVIRAGSWNQSLFPRVIECLNDMRTVATELWTGQPKELIPWLEELAVMAKEYERFTRIRVELGTAPPQDYDAAIRHRLAAEAALWEVKKGR